MNSRHLAIFLLACACGWVLAQGSLLFLSRGLLASYDFPGHLHMSAVQMRSPSALWDTAWYAGYPTYMYPPLAHRLAGGAMRVLGLEGGFKVSVVAALAAAVPAVYAAARVVAGLPPVPAAASTIAVLVTPALFRAFLFGQYPSLVAYVLFFAALAALFASLQASRQRGLLAALAGVSVAALGSTHLYTLLLLAVVLAPLALLVSWRLLLPRVAAPFLGGIALASFPSALLLLDLPYLSKVPIPHITRSAQMLEPAGLLTWLLYPAGLPVVVGALAVAPVIVAGRRMLWASAALVLALGLYVGQELGLPWTIVTLAGAGLLVLTLGGGHGAIFDWQTRYLALAGLLSLWLALGPVAGLARLFPYSDLLVYDRPLLYGAPLALLGLARILWAGAACAGWRRFVPAAVVLSAAPLLLLSNIQVLRTYAWLVPAAEGRVPQGTALRAEYTAFLDRYWTSGRLLALGFPPIVHTLPDVVGIPLIDGAYNDGRVLPPLRRSGVEAIGSEKFTHADLRVTRYFLANAESYGIEWVMTADRFYESAIPFDRFRLVHESVAEGSRRVRIYRSIFRARAAWEGAPRVEVTETGRISLGRARWGTGGAARDLEIGGEGSPVGIRFSVPHGTGWVFAEIPMPASRRCDRIVFEGWSPTGAALTVRVLQGGRFAVFRPETALGPQPSSIGLAVDCRQAEGLHVAISGTGRQQASLTAVRFEEVRDATALVPFAQTAAECIEVSIPRTGATITASVPAFHRWRSDSGLTITSDVHGLLTLSGPLGSHTVCLTFPPPLRAARTYLPQVYVALAALMGILIWRGHASPARMPGGSRTVLFLGLLTAIREVALRHRLPPDIAWDARAREAPDWFATFTRTPEQWRRSASADLRNVLDGIDPSRLRHSAVLDLGCGPGRLLEQIAPLAAAAYGVDISQEMITLAQRRLDALTNVTLIKNDGYDLSMLRDRQIDLVYCVNVFQHIHSRDWVERYMLEIYRVLVPGGVARIQVDGRAESAIWRLAKRVVGDDSWVGQLFTRSELHGLARRCGFVVERCGFTRDAGIRWKRQGLWLSARKML